ncbi:hypothetical protein LXL04_010688 [Taraxacum kok-saghyz]
MEIEMRRKMNEKLNLGFCSPPPFVDQNHKSLLVHQTLLRKRFTPRKNSTKPKNGRIWGIQVKTCSLVIRIIPKSSLIKSALPEN